jgi:hypothetical protein
VRVDNRRKGKEEATPRRAAVGTTHKMPDDAVLDQRREGLAIGHIGGDAMLDAQLVPTADLI